MGRNIRRVRCVETNEVFPNFTRCKVKYRISNTVLYKALKNGDMACGLHFEYIDLEPSSPGARITSKVRPVKCIETGEQWDYLTRCAEEIGISASWINQCIKFNEPIKGLHYQYVV